MATYKLSLSRDGRAIGEIISHFGDDLGALETAEWLSIMDQSVVVHEGDRFVARVKRGNQPLNVLDLESG